MRRGQPERASERLGEALALWRGPPLPELAGEPFARAQLGRLEDARLEAIEKRLEAELQLGHQAEALAELEPLVAHHPYREHLHELRMLALYRAGRQADALAAYRDARRVLVEELGIEPGRGLRELNDAILAQDPALDGPRRAPPTAPEPPALEQPSPSPPRARWPPAAGAAAVALVVLVIVLLLPGEDDASQPLSKDSHAVVAIDPASNQPTVAASVGTNPGPLAYEPDSDSLWVGNIDDESVTRIDLDPVRTGKTIAIGQPPTGLAAGQGVVWVTSPDARRPYVTARRIDTRFDSAGRPVRIASLSGESVASAALEHDTLWVAPSLGLLTRLNAETGRRVGPAIELGSSPAVVATGAGAVWTVDKTVVSRIDPDTAVVQPIRVADGGDGHRARR